MLPRRLAGIVGTGDKLTNPWFPRGTGEFSRNVWANAGRSFAALHSGWPVPPTKPPEIYRATSDNKTACELVASFVLYIHYWHIYPGYGEWIFRSVPLATFFVLAIFSFFFFLHVLFFRFLCYSLIYFFLFLVLSLVSVSLGEGWNGNIQGLFFPLFVLHCAQHFSALLVCRTTTGGSSTRFISQDTGWPKRERGWKEAKPPIVVWRPRISSCETQWLQFYRTPYCTRRFSFMSRRRRLRGFNPIIFRENLSIDITFVSCCVKSTVERWGRAFSRRSSWLFELAVTIRILRNIEGRFIVSVRRKIW